MPFQPGQLVSDYEILGVLGKGGMGSVYRVRNVISNRIEAMKVLLADMSAEPELAERFGGEIRTLARLDHQNIAKLYTALKAENQLVMIMEFVEGFTLSERARQGPIPIEEVISYISQTLAALGYAHQNGVVHRDIKPSNIMVTPHAVVKLMDFGIAKSSTEAMHTRVGTTMGSMLYMSPEQVRGNAVDHRSDLYSLGVVLYELTAGKRPFESDSTYAVLEAQLNTPPKPPVELNPALPQALNDIILTALEKEPMRRFQSAEAFRKALESLKAPQPAVPQAHPAAVRAPVVARSGNNRAIWMALGAVVCVLVLIAAVLAVPHFRHTSASTKTDTTMPVQTASSAPAQATNKAAALAAPEPAVQPVPQNQTVNPTTPAVHRHGLPSAPARSAAQPAPTTQTTSALPANAAPVSPAVSSTAPAQPAGPSQEEIDKVQESLMQMHSRADAIRGSVNSLRRQQAADGFEISPEISGAASRLDNYLQAADRAAQQNDLNAARKYMDGAEKQLSFLEAKFGR